MNYYETERAAEEQLESEQAEDGGLFGAIHSGPCHLDEALAAAFLIAEYPDITILRTRDERRLEGLKDGPHFVADVGREYDPERRLFDHHHDPKLHSSFVLVAKHLFGEEWIEQAEEIFPWWTAMDIADRRGINKALAMTNPTAIAVSPIGTVMRNRIANVQEIAPGDDLHAELRRVGKNVIARHEEVRQTVGHILRVGQMHTVALLTDPLRVDYTADDVKHVAEQHMDPPFIARVFESPVPADGTVYRLVRQRLRERGQDADLTITRTETSSWSVNRSRRIENIIDLTVCEEYEGCTFAHNQGFIAVFEQRSRAFHGLLQAVADNATGYATYPEYTPEGYGEPTAMV